MQVVIDIPDEDYEIIKNSTRPMYYSEYLIKHGIALPKGATNGDVIMTLFPNGKITRGIYGLDTVPLVYLDLGTGINPPEMSFKKSWWNAPYESESEE